MGKVSRTFHLQGLITKVPCCSGPLFFLPGSDLMTCFRAEKRSRENVRCYVLVIKYPLEFTTVTRHFLFISKWNRDNYINTFDF